MSVIARCGREVLTTPGFRGFTDQRPRNGRLDATARRSLSTIRPSGPIRNVAGMAVAPYAAAMGESGPSNACGHASPCSFTRRSRASELSSRLSETIANLGSSR